MSKPNLRDPSEDLPVASDARQSRYRLPIRVLPMRRWHACFTPNRLRMASDPSSGTIAHWKHEPLHDIVEPMTDHVIMAYNGSMQRVERRSGRSVAIGTFRPGVVMIIPAGSSSRWDIPKPVDVVQLYLPHTTLERVAGEADSHTDRSPGANGASGPHYIPTALECGRCPWRAMGPWIRCSGSS